MVLNFFYSVAKFYTWLVWIMGHTKGLEIKWIWFCQGWPYKSWTFLYGWLRKARL